jgi:uncharacterized protein YndB with AHSA1/START domain
MAAPLLQAQIDINAPVPKVWALVSDLSRMPQWSPQCRLMKTFGPVRQGARTINVNRRNRLFWPTTSVVTEVIPDKKTAFSNMSINAMLGGVPSFERELVDGMNATLSRIKAAAES